MGVIGTEEGADDPEDVRASTTPQTLADQFMSQLHALSIPVMGDTKVDV
jgi:hypothetical protein